MTEEEAKTKWCPMSRVGVYPREDGIGVYTNRDGFHNGRNPDACIGSACMMWRFDTLKQFYEDQKKPTGYCGLVR